MKRIIIALFFCLFPSLCIAAGIRYDCVVHYFGAAEVKDMFKDMDFKESSNDKTIRFSIEHNIILDEWSLVGNRAPAKLKVVQDNGLDMIFVQAEDTPAIIESKTITILTPQLGDALGAKEPILATHFRYSVIARRNFHSSMYCGKCIAKIIEKEKKEDDDSD